ncbi:glycosyltransferase family 4 protein [Komarekiella sp. 'clone 1']|uniref:Glycosyltransferase family 4 protein n=1 Tax=Komarekiella delphini-convector SJRDD-AB1 TaxID=2593771 RepID=A0AA40T4K7_9NOST|nr:glycosyltransferase family 4 protein [Komarekiella delphini-convector]MBD6620512.1 glycosyltransferase family 4 protein [Komarekiella delphini-convector SJRDD-AB1]
MRKLLILPGDCDVLGGTVVTLSLLIKGFEQLNVAESLCVLVRADSLIEKYLHQAGQRACVKSISANNQVEFCTKALQWVNQQPSDYPLLLDNCNHRLLQLVLLRASPRLRLNGRPVFYFFHDLSLSYNYVGYLLRKLTFVCLAPVGICNSHFTAKHVRQFRSDIRAIMYQPVDLTRFQRQVILNPPSELQPILKSGAKIILTPSRLNQPGGMNDKNLRSLIPVLAQLRASGHHFHCVIIGHDASPVQIYTQELLRSAKNAHIADYFTILPPTFAIEDYYSFADIVVTLAPREPFGRIVVEAIACGVPIVGSCTGGIGEILSHFASEWMVDPNDTLAAAQTIIRVTNDANTPKVLIKAKSWVEQNCTIDKYTQTMMEISGLISLTSKQKELNRVC